MFFEQKSISFADINLDDNTPYLFNKKLEVFPSKPQICAPKLLEWFSNNYTEMNFDKCHLIIVLIMEVRK